MPRIFFKEIMKSVIPKFCRSYFLRKLVQRLDVPF